MQGKLLLLLGTLLAGPAIHTDAADARAATERMAVSVMQAWPRGVVTTTRHPGEWGYEEGVLLDGLAAECGSTHNPAELAYIEAAVDKYVLPDGRLQMSQQGRAYPGEEHQLDNIELGRAVLFCYRMSHAGRYALAARFLHEQLSAQPRTSSGGFWHKQIYPDQMWLDGAYMAEPFRAEYAATFHTQEEFPDIARQFLLMDEHMRDPATGLLRHGWDESKKMPWADPATGLSPIVWDRAVGWYAMGLVDSLDWMPAGSPQRPALLAALRHLMEAVVRIQDADGLWWQVMDRPGDTARGNFPESSGTAMFVYALQKGSRLGYLPGPAFSAAAAKGWAGLQKRFVRVDPGGSSVLTGTVKAAGLGGTPYRSGTFEYYVREPVGEQDAKGVGAYLLAGSEMGR